MDSRSRTGDASAPATPGMPGRQALFEAAFYRSTVPITISEPGTDRLVEINQAACQMLGLERSEALGRTPADVGLQIVQEDRAAIEAVIRATGAVTNVPLRYLRSGEERWGSMSASVIDVDGKPCLMASVIDITEQRKAEDALRASESRFAAAFTGAGVMMLITRLAEGGRVVDVNDAFLRMSGLTREQVIGKSAEQLGLFADPSSRDEMVAQLQATGRVRGLELPVRAPDGRQTHGLFSADVINLGGEPHAIVTVVDLTDRLTAEEQLRTSELRYRNLVEQTADGVLMLNDEGVILDVNTAMAELVGRTTEELRGTSWVSYIEPENLSELPFLRPDYEAGKPVAFERRVVRPDGSVIEIEIHARRYAEGLMVGTAHDIGSRKAAERERARLTQTIEQSVDATLICDANGIVQYINPAMAKRVGCDRTAVIGRHFRELEHDERVDEFYTQLLENVVRDGVWSGELASRGPDGRSLVEWVTVSAVKDESGNVVSFVGVRRDVTHEHELEELLRQAQKMEAVGRLAGGVAHDFNNLLTAILGFTELAAGHAAPDGELGSYLAEIKASAQRAASLTRQLLTFGRRAAVNPEILDLNEVCREIEPMLRRIIGEDVELTFEPGPDLRYIKADRGQIEQVVVNLAVNARDAMPAGGKIAISTSNVRLEPAQAQLHPTGTPRDNVRLAIADTGVGIDPEVRDLIWEPFFTTKPKGSGVGLGLATVFGIVRGAGGHIHVDSEPGRGSVFMIDLPVATEEPEVARTAEPAIETRRGEGTILVVEDEESVLGFAAQLLQRNGYRVLRATNGAEAVAAADGHPGPIDLLFSDMVMPGMNGQDVAAVIAARRPGIKLLFSSGYSEETNLRPGGGSGLPFVAKPYTGEELLGAVRTAIAGESQVPR